MEDKTENLYKYLEIANVSQVNSDGGAYLAILKETDGKRMIPVLMEKQDAMLLLLKSKKNMCPTLPWICRMCCSMCSTTFLCDFAKCAFVP